MGILSQVTKGKIEKPFFMVLYGPSGIGKSTFAAGAKDVLFIGNEEGTYNLNTSRAPKSKSFDDVMKAIAELRSEKHNYKTVAIDSLGGIEPLVWDAVCKIDGSKSIDLAQGGYGKGYVFANKLWQQMINDLFSLREEKGMNIICIAHSLVKSFNDPLLTQPYDRYYLNMNDKAAALWTREVDMLGFANEEVFLKIGQTEKKNRALGEGKRVLYTQRQPGFEAKNRLGLPAEMILDFAEFENALSTSVPPTDSEALKNEIADMYLTLQDEKTKEGVQKAMEKAGTDLSKMVAVRNRLKEVTASKGV